MFPIARPRAALSAVLLSAMLLTLCGAGQASAHALVLFGTPQQHVLVFRLSGARPASIVSARLEQCGNRRSLDVRRLRMSARRGELRIHTPKPWHPCPTPLSTRGRTAKLRLVLTALKLKLAPVNSILPTISGSLLQGQTLSATTGKWLNSPTSYAYRWKDCDTTGTLCTAISGATSSQYALAAADVGHTVEVAVTASNSAGSSTALSLPSILVAAPVVTPVVAPPANTSLPTITGTPTVGLHLTASTGTWSGNPTGYAYQWSDCDATGASCTFIAGATSSTYAVASSDAGHTIRVNVTASNSGGSALAVSQPTAAVAGAVAPPPLADTAPPAITGTPTQGQVLSASTGTWTGSPTGYAYAWQDCDTSGANCAPIGGATSSSYTLGAGDVGHTVAVTVTATASTGSAAATSAPTAVVASSPTPATTPTAAPANTAPPAIGASPVQGQAVSVTDGSWTNSPTTFAYQWYACDAVGLACAAIPAATSSSYTPGGADIGHTLYATVSAGNSAGSASSQSALTPAVALAGGSPTAANLWVSASGGSCARSSNPVAFAAGTSCGSLEAAYQAAACGDTVLIQGGDYSATPQELVDDPSKDSCTSPVVMQPAPGATATFGMIDDNDNQQGASWLAIKGINLTQVVNLTGAHNVTLDGITGGSVFIGGAQHVLIENSNFGPCFSGTPQTGSCTNNFKIDSNWQFTNGGPFFKTSDVTVIHNSLANFINNAPPPNNHFECAFVRGGQDIMFDANRFHVCQHYGILLQPVDPGPDGTPGDNVIIQNNTFDETENNPTGDGNSDLLHGAVDFGANYGQITNTLIRYNSFAPYDGVYQEATGGIGPNVRVYGNVGGDNWYNQDGTQYCVAGVVYGYNVWTGSSCSSTDTTSTTLPYVSQTIGSEDFHLVCNSIAKGFVTTNASDFVLGFDRQFTARSAGVPTEAGAESEASCGT